MKNIIRPYWDGRFNTSIKKMYKDTYNFLMEGDLLEPVINFLCNQIAKLYRFIEVKFTVWYERQFDAIQRGQLKISYYLFRAMFLFCFIGYFVIEIITHYNTQPLLTPIVEAKEIEEVQQIEVAKPELSITELIDYIHMQESSRGNATIGLSQVCKDRGQTNEYGYRAMDAWKDGVYYPEKAFCFDSQAEAVLTIKAWLEKQVNKYGTYEALCIYNTGTTKNGNCEYAEILKSWRAN